MIDSGAGLKSRAANVGERKILREPAARELRTRDPYLTNTFGISIRGFAATEAAEHVGHMDSIAFPPGSIAR